jgi:hypothetical protein
MVIAAFELQSCPNDTLLESEGLVCHEIVLKLSQLLCLLSSILERRFQVVRLRQISVYALNRLNE